MAATVTAENITTMNVAQLRSAIKEHFTEAAAIEKKYPQGEITDAADEAEVKRLLSSIDQMEDRLLPLEQAEERKERILKGVGDYNRAATPMHHADPMSNALAEHLKSPGEQFIDSDDFKRLIESGILGSDRNKVDLQVPLSKGTNLLDMIQRKALIYAGTGHGGGLVNPDLLGLRVPALQRPLSIIDLITAAQTSSDVLNYVRETAWTNYATGVAEASATTGTTGRKPEAAFAFSPDTSPVRTIAHWVPVTNRMLADAPAIRGMIDARLLLGLELALEYQVVQGAGTGEDFTGILNTTGVQITGPGTFAGGSIDAIFDARTKIRVNGLVTPNAVCLYPNDFQQMRLARESAASATQGGYLMGPPNQIGPTTLWGMPVVESLALPENTGLVGDFSGISSMLFEREGAAIRVGLIDDQFVRNMQTILAELRAAFVVFRAASYCKVTGI